jgi:hypothetical protein
VSQEEEMVMASTAGLRRAVEITTDHDAPAEPAAPGARDGGIGTVPWRLIAIPVACVLLAGVCTAALSRLVVPVVASSAAPIEQGPETDPETATIYEMDGHGRLRTLGPMFSR